MKKLIAIATLALASLNLFAQTNTPPAPTDPLDFFKQVGQWGTSFNTNETWVNTPVSIYTAANFQSGAQVSAEVGFSYDLWHVSTNLIVSPEANIRNASVGGVVVSEHIGAALYYVHYDLEAGGYIDGGYREDLRTGEIEVGFRAKKKMTTSTYALASCYWDVPFAGVMTKTPSFTVGVGYTF